MGFSERMPPIFPGGGGQSLKWNQWKILGQWNKLYRKKLITVYLMLYKPGVTCARDWEAKYVLKCLKALFGCKAQLKICNPSAQLWGYVASGHWNLGTQAYCWIQAHQSNTRSMTERQPLWISPNSCHKQQTTGHIFSLYRQINRNFYVTVSYRSSRDDKFLTVTSL